jgi:hypothetical protein
VWYHPGAREEWTDFNAADGDFESRVWH